MNRVRIIVLGNEVAGDDGAALIACRRLSSEFEVLPAGRPGPELLDLLRPNEAAVLVDVTRGAGDPGQVTSVPLCELPGLLSLRPQLSSHGLGPAEVIRLAGALGRRLPFGFFVGIEGARFGSGDGLSSSVADNLDRLLAAVENAARAASMGPGSGEERDTASESLGNAAGRGRNLTPRA